MELQNHRKAPIKKARPTTGKAARSGSRLRLPVDWEKNVRLVLGALLFLGATWWALTRYSRPDPFRKPELFSWAWFIHPLEVNAPARLPVVSGTLTSLAVAEGGKSLWVAGQEGMVLRYKASTQQWENLSVPDTLGRGLSEVPIPEASGLSQPWRRPRIGEARRTGSAAAEGKPDLIDAEKKAPSQETKPAESYDSYSTEKKK